MSVCIRLRIVACVSIEFDVRTVWCWCGPRGGGHNGAVQKARAEQKFRMVSPSFSVYKQEVTLNVVGIMSLFVCRLLEFRSKPYCLYDDGAHKASRIDDQNPRLIWERGSRSGKMTAVHTAMAVPAAIVKRRRMSADGISQKTMRLRVFCNYFMYTLITFITSINMLLISAFC